jgi:hypothetical protein
VFSCRPTRASPDTLCFASRAAYAPAVRRSDKQEGANALVTVTRIRQLPESLIQEISDFVDFLLTLVSANL